MISICMAYFNRKKQLYKTIESINESSIKDYEIIIVDDASEEIHQLNLNELKTMSNGNIILFRINKNKKTWYNSCIAYNIAFSVASGDQIIIQNPETFHMGDILLKVKSALTLNNYYTFHTIALNEDTTNRLYEISSIKNIAEFMQPIINSTNYVKPGHNPYDGNIIWYNHKTYRPNHYHFISAIMKDDLYKLGGFDERYQYDHSWDDNELLIRIDRLQLKKHFIDNPLAIHLYHPRFYTASPYNGQRNLALYHNTTLHETNIKLQELDFNNYKDFLI